MYIVPTAIGGIPPKVPAGGQQSMQNGGGNDTSIKKEFDDINNTISNDAAKKVPLSSSPLNCASLLSVLAAVTIISSIT